MSTKTDISKYVVNVQGKDFITFPGLLQEAHAQGLREIDTQLVNTDLNNPVIKATVTLVAKLGMVEVLSKFTGYGDANNSNVAKKVVGALIRMAETRAVARALRFACNIDMTAIEELDVEDHSASKPTNPVKSFGQRNQQTSTNVEVKVVNGVGKAVVQGAELKNATSGTITTSTIESKPTTTPNKTFSTMPKGPVPGFNKATFKATPKASTVSPVVPEDKEDAPY